MSNTQNDALKSAGFQRSSTNENKWINPTNGHWVKQHEGGSTTVSTSRHNRYGAGMSGNALSERLNK